VRPLLLILGLTLTVYPTLDIELRTRFARDQSMEQQFCQFRLCDDQRMYRAAAKKLWGTATPNPKEAAAGFLVLLRRDPNFPFPWANLGDALSASQRSSEARYCFRQAVALAPHWPPILMRAATFYLESGDLQAALPLTSQILDQVAQYDSLVFSSYARETHSLRLILDGGFPQNNPRPARAWVSYLIGKNDVLAARQAFSWLHDKGLDDVQTTDAYVNMLLFQHLAPEALNAWKTALGTKAGSYGESNYAFNGGFESDFSTSPLDWKSEPRAGVEVSRDDITPDFGKWSLKIHLDGKHNITDTGIHLKIAVPRGRYRLTARIRTEGLTTDEGIELRLRSLDRSPFTQWTSRSWLGTNAWSTLQANFEVPVAGNSYTLELLRNASQKFDRNIAGTIWIDNVRMEPYR